MGVQGLWELLAPVGRRVSVEALSGRKLAIDASIWIIQFMKAMRDDKGDMIRNAHLLGFFRRICKLLYLRAKPVFVFDGATPVLKRRTVIARRRQRERAQSKIRKTAEKLLLNHLLLNQVARSRENKEQEVSKLQDRSQPQPLPPPPPPIPSKPSQDNSNGKWTEPLISETGVHPATSDVENSSDDSDDSNEQYFMPPAQGHVDPAVLASLPPSMQLNLLVQMREQLVTDNRKKFQKVAKNPASFSQMQIQAYLKTVAFRRDINEVQKAAAGKGIGGIPSARIASEVDREYIFSTTFKPEQQAAVADKGETHETSQISQDNLHTSGIKESQERLSQRLDIDQSVAMAERASSQKSSSKEDNSIEDKDIGQSVAMAERANSQKSSSKEDNSIEDKDIEWEDEEEAVSLKSQPVQGAVITIEIDQDDLLAEGIEVQKLHPDNGPVSGSEDEDIEWEDEAVDCISGIEQQEANGDHMIESDIGTASLASNRMSAGSTEIVDKTLMEIEAAELEEAIRQSLQDHTGHKAPKLVIREDSNMEIKQNDLLPLDFAAAEAPISEEAFLARERERKGKAIVDNDRAVGESEILTLKRKNLNQVSDLGYLENCKPPIVESQNVSPSRRMFHLSDGTSQAQADDITRSPSNLESCKPSVSTVDIAAPSEVESNIVCAGAILTNNVTDVRKSEDEGVVKVDANICESVEAPNGLEVNTKLSSLGSSLLSSKLLDEELTSLEEKLPTDKVLQVAVANDENVVANKDAVLEHEHFSTLTRNYAVPSVIGSNTAAEDDHLQEVLLKEAEEIDLIAEQEAFAKQERDLLAEREELSRRQAELQAEMEAEQAAMQANLQEEEMELRATQRKNERNAESVTGEMFSECQELLQMFGLPYIIAPMEAEAQCAFMDSIGLVDGVVTEDSDVFLFGGRNVFKNIFDDRKYVETYYMKDVESELGLDQEKLIHMALLLGSDYTEGISGIGIVNAIEVVNTFEGEVGLQNFKDWLDAPDLTLLNKVQQDGQKKQSKKSKENEAGAEEPDDPVKEGSRAAKYSAQQQDFIDKHRAVSKNWNVPENFPNPMVISAYTLPQVDRSSESFSWGRPDLEALRRMCLERFGWNKSKSDELLLPVLKEYDRHETQLRLEAFYTFNQRFAKIRSKRIQKAVTKGTGRRLSSELVDLPKGNDSEESSPTRRKAKDLKHKHDDEPIVPSDMAHSKRTAGPKRRKKEASQGEKVVGQEVSTRGRGRGRGRTSSSRGKAATSKRSNARISAEASLSDESSSEEILDLADKERMDKTCHGMPPRRSSRLPQRAVYNFSGSEEGSDSALGASLEGGESPGNAGTLLPLEVKSPALRAEEANLNQDDEERGKASPVGDVDDPRYGLQGQADEEYLFMGGGFCPDDDTNQEQAMESLVSVEETKGLAPGDDSIFVSEGSAHQDDPVVSSNALQEEIPSSKPVDRASRNDEPSLQAVPFLRRKKQRRMG